MDSLLAILDRGWKVSLSRTDSAVERAYRATASREGDVTGFMNFYVHGAEAETRDFEVAYAFQEFDGAFRDYEDNPARARALLKPGKRVPDDVE